MTGLPKFVRDQMGRTPAPSSHPDANLLTAFAENTLTAKEHRQVTEHLSVCADCREIVFLAQPEAVQTQAVLNPKPRRFTWMAWASVAAVVVVVASAVIMQHEQVTKTQQRVTVATTTTPPPSENKLVEPTTKSDTETPSTLAIQREEPRHRKPELGAAKTKPSPNPIFTAKDATVEMRDLKPPAPAAVPPPTTDQEVFVAHVPLQQAPTGPVQRNIAGQIQQAQGPANTANNVNGAVANDTPLAKAESAPSAKVAKKQRAGTLQGIVAGYAAPPAAAPLPAARAHWQISATGTLERSLVADSWTPVLTETGTKFHVVSVIGNSVWAGGEHGTLYVSRDGGANWNPIAIDTTATITSVHFSDDSHGTLQTAAGESWKTADAGKTWQKQ